MKIAYLCCRDTHPASPHRRADAHEHDQSVACLRDALSPGDRLDEVLWDEAGHDWGAYDAALIGTTWDYADRPEKFHEVLTSIEAQTRLFNGSALIRWNSDKKYLRDLTDKGVLTIPTIWLDMPMADDIGAAFDTLGTDDLVAKRRIGAGAEGQHRLKRGQPVPAMSHPMMVQPFLSSIVEEGELSFIFVGGDFSHALLKQAGAGDYRIQSIYGGRETAIEPTARDLAAASQVLEALDEAPLYARVDMIRGEDGQLLLMELELVEPFLYVLQGPRLGPMMVAALKARLD